MYIICTNNVSPDSFDVVSNYSAEEIISEFKIHHKHIVGRYIVLNNTPTILL